MRRIHFLSMALVTLTLHGCTVAMQKADDTPPLAGLAAVDKLPERPIEPSLATRLLSQAERRFSEGKLLNPDDDNAYLYYQATLMMNEGSETARSGLQAILLHELNVARDLFASNRVSAGERHVQLLEELFPNDGLIVQLKQDIVAARKARQVKPKPQPKVAPAEDVALIVLDEKALKQETAELLSLLRNTAQSLVKTRESVLIYARNDGQGRWIYQKMREAVPGYRIRGDIRIGRPAIRVLPPLE